jgi:hypothetical protein
MTQADALAEAKSAALTSIQPAITELAKTGTLTKADIRQLADTAVSQAAATAMSTFMPTLTKPATATKTAAAVSEATTTAEAVATSTTATAAAGGGARLPVPKPGATEKEKREFANSVDGLVARRRGELNGQSLWLIDYYPYGDKDKMTLLGSPPKGAKPASGKGSLKASATLIRGIPPSKPLYRDTGAVDDIISHKDGKIVVESVPDEKVKRGRGRPPKARNVMAIDVGGGIEVDKHGRGHIKI